LRKEEDSFNEAVGTDAAGADETHGSSPSA
jgi:hypothetical protein